MRVVVGDPVTERGAAVSSPEPFGGAEQVFDAIGTPHSGRESPGRTASASVSARSGHENANALTAGSRRSIAESAASTNSRADSSPERTSAAW